MHVFSSYMEGKTLISRQALSLQLLGLEDLTVGLRSYLLDHSGNSLYFYCSALGPSETLLLYAGD